MHDKYNYAIIKNINFIGGFIYGKTNNLSRSRRFWATFAINRRIKKQLSNLRKEKADAYENGGDGFHDNFAFEDAERVERGILYEIQEKTAQLDRIVIVEKKAEDVVEINDILSLTITSPKSVTTNLYKLIATFQLPTGEEPYINVSLNSPIGQAIFHKNIGEEVKCNINGNETLITIGNKVKEEVLSKKRTKK